MENFLRRFRDGIYLGVWMLATLSLGVFAYQYTSYLDIPDASSGNVLTSSTFNQLLANVRDLNSRSNSYIADYYAIWTAQTLSNGVGKIVNYDTKLYDPYNLVTTGTNWSYTVPVTWVYRITSNIQTAWVDWASHNSMWMWVAKNGASYKEMNGLFLPFPLTAMTGVINGSVIVEAQKGDTLGIMLYIWRGTTTNVSNNGTTWITVEKVVE